jgi:oxygen-independent coproporphyrinogen-3 oxidase
MTNPSLVSELDASLLERYAADRRRAFEYPPAAQLRADFDERALRAAIRASNEEPIPRPLALRVRIPACAGAKLSGDGAGSAQAHVARYLERLYREIELIAPLLDRDRPVLRLHLGGAGVDALDQAAVRELMESLTRHFSFSTQAQRVYGVAVNPLAVDAAHVHALAALGFNHLAIRASESEAAWPAGADPAQVGARTGAMIAAAREAGMQSARVHVACDQAVMLAVDAACASRADHVVLETKGAAGAALAPPACTAAFAAITQRLADAGYVHLGMAQFVRADGELAVAQRAGVLQWVFTGYSTQDDCDIIGLGAGARSGIGDSCSRSADEATGYAAALDDGRLPVARGLSLDEDDLIRRELIATLVGRCIIDKATFGARHRLLFDEYFVRERQRLRPLIAEGLLEEDARALRVTSRGRLLLRIIGRCFDAYRDVEVRPARHVRAV